MGNLFCCLKHKNRVNEILEEKTEIEIAHSWQNIFLARNSTHSQTSNMTPNTKI